jgi:peptidylprolyl isomerase
MSIKNGDFVLVDYILKVKDTGEVFDVTMEEEAKAANVYNPEVIYEPRLIIVGEGWVIKGLEEALIDMQEGSEKTIEIPPEKAFGERDPSKIKTISARELTKQGITPRLGMRINVDGALATIRSVGSGRVIIDFNHPLSGKFIISKIIVRKIITDTIEKIRELIHMRIRNVPKEKFIISKIDSILTIEMPEETFLMDDIKYIKRGIVRDIGKYFKDFTSVQFIETYNLKPKEQPKEQKEQPKEESKEQTK